MSSKFVKTNKLTTFPLYEIFDFRGEFSSSGLKKVTTTVPGPKFWVTNDGVGSVLYSALAMCCT